MMASEQGQSDVQMRLRRVEGQIRGIISMLDQGKTCEEVVTQLLAARAAMDRVTTEVLKCHVAEAMSGKSPTEAREAVERAITLLAKV
jgi:CsoR family transcriptional regulator, copper-sensing transcriptional repressor